MCEAIKYLVDGRTKISEIAVNSPELPVARRGGGVHFIRWGADKGEDSIYLDPDEGPGRLLSLPKGYWVELDQIKSDFRWSEGRQVRPVKIAATEFMVNIPLDGIPLSRWIRLRSDEYIQGALARIHSERRVYVVSVPAPTRFAGAYPCWPRVVRANAASRPK